MIKNLHLASTCFVTLLGFQLPATAQWCVPNSIIPYNANMPGITHVVLGSIDRTSSDLENYPNNSYVLTGLSVDLIPGNTYNVSVTHTIDASICPDMNIRVWIDYNVDYSFDDAGETVISVDHHAAGTYSGSFTVPATAAPGATRLRITAKMSNLGGHTLPTPCDIPADPLGYHGEMEDYAVNIVNTTGIQANKSESSLFTVYPTVVSGHAAISFSLNEKQQTSLTIYNSTGQSVWNEDVDFTSAGRQEILLDERSLGKLRPGLYFIVLDIAGNKQAKRMILE